MLKLVLPIYSHSHSHVGLFVDRPWWFKDTVAVVTGANKGVGCEIVRLLAQQGLTVVLTARDLGRGQAAIDALKADGQKSIHFHPLDVRSSESVETLAEWLKTTFGGIDIIVSVTDCRSSGLTMSNLHFLSFPG